MLRFLYAAAVVFCSAAAFAQVTPAAGYTPPDDTPSVKLGGTIFADYTYVESPEAQDADKNSINQSSFNVSRAYLNITGNVFHRVSYRITPDIARETGSGSSLSGSYTFRLKYAYGQFNLDDWTTKGSWLRFGLQQTPWIDYEEGMYRYRFQGPTFVDREGFLTSSDYAFSGHWNFPGNYGDVHAGFYNGEGYSRAEANNEKAFQVRAAVRPFPLGGNLLKGLRLAAFVDSDHYVQDAKRQRLVGAITYEHPAISAGLDYLDAKDRTSALTGSEVHATGYSAWATPKLPHNFEILLRHDELKPNKDTNLKRKRNIAGVAYWMPARSGVTSALLVDYDSLQQSGYSPERPDDTRYAIKLLVNF
ncbi:MAG: porin [Thermoanaerobaculia bacterium]